MKLELYKNHALYEQGKEPEFVTKISEPLLMPDGAVRIVVSAADRTLKTVPIDLLKVAPPKPLDKPKVSNSVRSK